MEDEISPKDKIEADLTSSSSARPADSKAAANDGAVPDIERDQAAQAPRKAEYGGPKGLEPTRYGDWERNGRCYDF